MEEEKRVEWMREHSERMQRELVESYKRLNRSARKGQILFTGSSLMEQFPITELAMTHGLGRPVYNRGVGGFTTDTFIQNIDTLIFDLEPDSIFINIGTNDLSSSPDGIPWQEKLRKNYGHILGQIKERLPEATVYVMSYYPMDEDNVELEMIRKHFGSVRTNAILKEASGIAKELADGYHFHFINVNNGLADENGNLKKSFCKDAIHFYPDGYEMVYQNLKPYLESLK